MTNRILLLPGDGIGPEVMAAARPILDALLPDAEITEGLIGGAAIDATGTPLPEATRKAALESDAVLLAAVGGPKWDHLSGAARPEAGLLGLRRSMQAYANLRPIRVREATLARAPVRREIASGTDMLFVRELTGGLYFGEKGREGPEAFDVCRYSEGEIARTVRLAAMFARRRKGRLTLIDKANVLETSRLWREVAERIITEDFADLAYEVLLVDAAAMHLMTRPRDFDVIVTENLFGDILTDEASVLSGSLGLIPSASLGATSRGLYEPVHGSAPDIAGKGIANPLGLIESIAMLLEFSFAREAEAERLRKALDDALDAGIATADLGGRAGTVEMAEAVRARL